MTTSRDSLIQFPCAFPIKVMGAQVHGFAEAISGVIQAHDPSFNPATIEMRPSRNGNYLGLTVTVNVNSQAELDRIYMSLTQHPMVKVVL